MTANIAGPVCESGDTFAMGRDIDAVVSGDSRCSAQRAPMARRWRRPTTAARWCPRCLVDGDRFAVVADRIAAETILAAERVPDWLMPGRDPA